jgi:Zn-dependent peptidase ImmA (M78 family)/plasmid maintenance system antidote protein VapI
MSFAPNWVTPPGNTILDILEEKGMTIDAFSRNIREESNVIKDLLCGNYRIDSLLASKLKDSLGFSENFWLQRDKVFFERKQQLEAEWIKSLPLSEMKKRGWIDKKEKALDACLNFFGVRSLSDWNLKYRNQINNLAFRKSQTFETDLFSIAAWVRKAEIQTETYKIPTWNKDLFEQRLIENIKPLTRVKNPKDFLPHLIKECADCGVRLAIVPSLGKNRASGAVKFVGNNALMILSFRYLTDDHFWFTFFHEAGHLILHAKTEQLRVDTDSYESYNEDEHEANLFAVNCLVPYEIQHELENLNSNKRKLIKFAANAGVSPGIVVGQMQFRKIISFSYLNAYKRRFTWDDIQEGLKSVNL